MARVVYALDFEGAVLAFQPVDPIAGWRRASDEIIHRTAAGVFIGLGLLKPEQLATVQFSIRDAAIIVPGHAPDPSLGDDSRR